MPSGILLLDKPRGLSSNAALQRVKRAYGAAKAGHVGSLDPLATGMLPICLDEATKVAGEIVAGAKRYEFTVALGTRTATGDVEGEVVESQPVPTLDSMRVESVLASLHGEQQQVPPMFSALKRDGRPLYELARRGIEVERAARGITIHRLALVDLREGALDLAVECSKGTYVRTLAEDVARALGTCGHVTRLHRAWVAPFEGERMHALEAVEAACAAGAPVPLLPIDRGLPDWPAIELSAAAVARARQGQAIGRADLPRGAAAPGAMVRMLDPTGRLLGLGEVDGFGGLRPRRIFNL
ncbi:MAG TPA: tRNA pseudouridine(55) synthase TruB [Steroidobacteraceae bacterium]|nr:tRNA pseudouridine(55) synthase TruB [Steroidobacteraceae bacterium]